MTVFVRLLFPCLIIFTYSYIIVKTYGTAASKVPCIYNVHAISINVVAIFLILTIVIPLIFSLSDLGSG